VLSALLAEGVEERYATELLTDLVWKVYAKWVARCAWSPGG
jgi:hypothetical protein